MKKTNKSSFAGTEVQQSTNADNQHVSQPIAKPSVGRIIVSRDYIEERITYAFSRFQLGYSREAMIVGLANEIEEWLKESKNEE